MFNLKSSHTSNERRYLKVFEIIEAEITKIINRPECSDDLYDENF